MCRGAHVGAEERITIGEDPLGIDLSGVVVIETLIGEHIITRERAGAALVHICEHIGCALLEEVGACEDLPGQFVLDAEAPVDGARLVESVDDILQEFEMLIPRPARSAASNARSRRNVSSRPRTSSSSSSQTAHGVSTSSPRR